MNWRRIFMRLVKRMMTWHVHRDGTQWVSLNLTPQQTPYIEAISQLFRHDLDKAAVGREEGYVYEDWTQMPCAWKREEK